MCYVIILTGNGNDHSEALSGNSCHTFLPTLCQILVQRGLRAISIFLLFIVSNALGACIIVHNIVLCIVYNIRHTKVHYRYPQSVNQLCKYIVKCVQVVVFLAIKFWCS